MADKTTTKFPTMGTQSANPAVLTSQSPNVKYAPKSGNAKGGSIGEPATATNRADVLERNGFKGAPQIKHSYPNAPEAAQTYRNVRLVPSAIGRSQFWDKRQYGQAQQ